MKTAVFACLACIALVGACLWLTDQVFAQGLQMHFWRFYALRLTLLGMAGIALLTAFMACIVRGNLSVPGKRGCVAVVASLFAMMLLEVGFMFMPESHNVGYTLGAKVWYQRYWGQENSLGYRDPEPRAMPGKQLVFALGDSFTAGAGISRLEERFTNRLEAARPDLHVLNLGKCGADSETAHRCLLEHPLHPDVLVVQYYVNDIEGTAFRAGRSLPEFTPYQDLATLARFVVRNSFLLDNIYWRFSHTDQLAYVRFLEQSMNDRALRQRHFAELEQFCSYAVEHHVQLVVVIFPCLQDLTLGKALTENVEHLFSEHNVPIVDVGKLVASVPVGERTANRQDAHPSPRVHQLVADALAKAITPVHTISSAATLK